jgi:hypothetical protein
MSARDSEQLATAAIVAPERFDLRPCPPDFDEMYVLLGPKGLPEHYQAWNRTIRRWSEERGRDRLKELRNRHLAKVNEERRAKRVKSVAYRRREAAAKRAAKTVRSAEPMPTAETLRAAAHFLRHPRNGGFMVSPSGLGDWFLGSVRVTPQEIVRRAEARGFVATGA